jgi:SAM-dependent methyltransferase
MTDFLRATRSGYDAVATQYSLTFVDELWHKPLDRALLDRMAVDVGRLGPICDVGCGPGHVAGYLRERGAEVLGVDLSPRMIAEASRRYPGVQSAVGNMLALDLADASLGGLVAFYSLIHVPRELVGSALGEWRRVLRPGGRLLIGCHRGAGTLHKDEWWGQTVSLDFRFFERDELECLVRDAGFDIVQTVVRDPIPDVEYQSQRLYVLGEVPAA